jgi:hypothetical protein
MPNKVSDYIQARVPVVVSNFPEMGKVIDRFQVGEKINSHNELAEKVNIVLERGKIFYEYALNKAATELCWEKEEPNFSAFQKSYDKNISKGEILTFVKIIIRR